MSASAQAASSILFDTDNFTTCVAEQDGQQRLVRRCRRNGGSVEIEGVPSAGTITSIAAGNTWGCVVVDGRVYCWTRHSGYGTPNVAVEIPGIDNAVKADTTGNYTACALLDDGTVKCWGRKPLWRPRQRHESRQRHVVPPTQVVGLTNATSLAAGKSATCAGKSDGTVVVLGLGCQ